MTPYAYGLYMISAFGVPADKWKSATSTQSKLSGTVIGTLERILFFIVLWIGKPEIVAAWLVFKVASKWETWSNIIKAPSAIQGIDEVEALRARHVWGTRVHTRNLVGTLTNILLAFIAVWLAKIALN